MNGSSRSSRLKLLLPLHLTAVVFFTVSGGPYGLEPVLHYVGGHTALLLVLLTPILWCIPPILMVLELNSMMPKIGGYYQCVKHALGLKWGFFEGWWSWLYTFVDLAIYPVLFVQYLSFFFPEVAEYRIVLYLAIIWGCTVLNLFGILPVGRSSVGLGVGVLVPFGILFAYLLLHGGGHGSLSTFPSPPPSWGFTAFGMGLYTVMWNFLGWDNSSPFVEEVSQPVRSYLIAIVVAFVLILAVYALSIVAGMSSGMNSETLSSEGFPSLGLYVGGWWLGALLSVGGMASALGLFLAILLSISRVPKAMADDGILSPTLSKLHPTYGTPQVSLLVCALVVSVMVLWGFADLLIIDVTLYGCGLILEFIALIVLRRREPQTPRPFKIPLALPGIVVLTILPSVCLFVAVAAMFSQENVHINATLFAIASVLSGPIVWAGLRWRKTTP